MDAHNITGQQPAPPAQKKQVFATLRCSSCNCDRLAIRHLSGLERIISRLTGTRKYRCFVCRKEFRAPDRRKKRRDAQGRVVQDELRIPLGATH